jgi:predicted DNA-binding transcriptional regulator AlpA
MATTKPAGLAPVSPPVLRPKDAARYLGLSLPTLQRMRSGGSGPAFLRLGEKAIAYAVVDLDAWLANRPRHTAVADRWREEAS